MSLQQCMGGWCGPRESCAHYQAEPTEGRPPADRLCGSCAEPVLWKAQAKQAPVGLRERADQPTAEAL